MKMFLFHNHKFESLKNKSCSLPFTALNFFFTPSASTLESSGVYDTLKEIVLIWCYFYATGSSTSGPQESFPLKVKKLRLTLKVSTSLR